MKLFVRRGHRPRQKKHGRSLLTFKGEEGKRPRQILIGVGALLLLLLLMSVFRAEPSLMSSAEVATVHDNGVLRVGVGTDMPGMAYEGEGLEIELAEMLAERILSYDAAWTGERDAVELVPVTSMTVASKLNDGSIDVAIAMMPRNATSAYSYSSAYYGDICRFVTRPGEGGRVIKNIKIGYLQSASTSELYVPTACFSARLSAYLEEHPDDGLITTYKYNEETISYAYASFDELFAALRSGEVDAIVMSDLYLDKYEGTYEFDRSETILGVYSYAIASASTAPALASLGDIMLSELREDGTLDALYQKYGLHPQLESVTPNA